VYGVAFCTKHDTPVTGSPPSTSTTTRGGLTT
jgi:hypothetical protein